MTVHTWKAPTQLHCLRRQRPREGSLTPAYSSLLPLRRKSQAPLPRQSIRIHRLQTLFRTSKLAQQPPPPGRLFSTPALRLPSAKITVNLVRLCRRRRKGAIKDVAFGCAQDHWGRVGRKNEVQSGDVEHLFGRATGRTEREHSG